MKFKLYYGKRAGDGFKFEPEEIRRWLPWTALTYQQFLEYIVSVHDTGRFDCGDDYKTKVRYLAYDDIDHERIRVSTEKEFQIALTHSLHGQVVKFYIELQKSKELQD